MNKENSRTHYHQLPNGLGIVCHYHDSPVGHCGLLIDAGSRDEHHYHQGIAHFMEHMLFKGTVKRKTRAILSHIDEVGGELNAYTGKENTFIYASFPDQYFERATDILADIAFNAVFPDKEIGKERDVILDEIHSLKDDPTEEISDAFDELIFGDHPLGKNILGTTDSVCAIRKSELESFRKEYYSPGRMVFCYVGKREPAKVFAMVQKYFGLFRSRERNSSRKAPGKYRPVQREVSRPVSASHCIIGNRSIGMKSSRRITLFLLNNILGGPGLNSRLNLGIREKYGYTYYLESSYTPYEDTGIWSVYFATDKRNLEKTIALLHREFEKLMNKELSSAQLSKAKAQLKGQLALANENPAGMLHVVAKSYQLYHRFDTLEQVYQKIDRITAREIQDMAIETFNPEKLSMLLYTDDGKK